MMGLVLSINRALGFLGIKIVRKNYLRSIPVEFSEEEIKLLEYVREKKLTMVLDDGLYATMMACKHAIDQNIPGDFVECGVWRGGNAMLAAGLFKLHGHNKKVFLFDTFAGMTEPSEIDRRASDGSSAKETFIKNERDDFNEWAYCSIDDVKENFRVADLYNDNVVFVAGDVLETLAIPQNLPEKIAVLRLDTDWYESTMCELETLYPLLSIGGSLIIDDYGNWAGSRKATDEYFEKNENRPFLQYVNQAIRMAIKYK